MSDDVVRRTRPDASDGELLVQFIATQDESAFRSLVEKHSGLVWSVCSRQLRFREDQEDAFQATFVTLARKAKTIRSGAFSSWLYKVAYRSSLNVARSRSRHADQPIVEDPEVVDNTFAQLHDREQAMILDEEINRLPEKLRSVVVMCCLEGKSRAEAADELNCTEVAVKSRLARGRQQLQVRLARRGIGLSVLLAAATAFSEDAAAQVPSRLVEAAVSAGVATNPDPPLTSYAESALDSVRSTLGSMIGSPISWMVALALLGSVAMVRSTVPSKPAEAITELQLEQTESVEKQIEFVVMTLEEDPAVDSDDPRWVYLQAKRQAYEAQVKATELEIEAYETRDKEKRTKLQKQRLEIKQAAQDRLREAMTQLVEYAQMKGLPGWSEGEAMRVIADANIDASDPTTNPAAVVAKMAEKARRFELPADADPVLFQIEEAPVDSGDASNESAMQANPEEE